MLLRPALDDIYRYLLSANEIILFLCILENKTGEKSAHFGYYPPPPLHCTAVSHELIRFQL